MLPTIANLANLAILIGFLGFMLRKPVSNMLRKRSDRVKDQLKNADDELDKAKDLKKQYEQKMLEIIRERDDILSSAQKSANETSRRLIAEANKEAGALRERAAANAQLEWDRAESELRTIIIDTSAIAAERFVASAINKETHDKLFTAVLSELEVAQWRG